jgi:hypothetical protein
MALTEGTRIDAYFRFSIIVAHVYSSPTIEVVSIHYLL